MEKAIWLAAFSQHWILRNWSTVVFTAAILSLDGCFYVGVVLQAVMYGERTPHCLGN